LGPTKRRRQQQQQHHQQQTNKLTDTRFRFQTKQTPYLKFQTGHPGNISRQTNEITQNCRLLKTFALLISKFFFLFIPPHSGFWSLDFVAAKTKNSI